MIHILAKLTSFYSKVSRKNNIEDKTWQFFVGQIDEEDKKKEDLLTGIKLLPI